MLYYNGYYLAGKMGQLLQIPEATNAMHFEKAKLLRDAIRSKLWLKQRGYYSYLEDENDETLTQMEGLGEALVLLSPEFETSSHRIRAILDRTYRTERGLPCLWPRFDNWNHKSNDIAQWYHNGRIWPFVQGYWAIAAARHRNEGVFAEEVLSLLHLAQGNSTFAEFYELDGTFPARRRRQLWSSSGFLGMVYHGIFGMTLQPEGIEFAPMKPTELALGETITLLNFAYRSCTFDIEVHGEGTNVASFSINGEPQERPFFPSDSDSGHHSLRIILSP